VEELCNILKTADSTRVSLHKLLRTKSAKKVSVNHGFQRVKRFAHKKAALSMYSVKK